MDEVQNFLQKGSQGSELNPDAAKVLKAMNAHVAKVRRVEEKVVELEAVVAQQQAELNSAVSSSGLKRARLTDRSFKRML